MALFVDRKSKFPHRRKLVNVKTKEETIYDVYREEGEIEVPGTPWNAKTMNNLFHEVVTFTPEIICDSQNNRPLNHEGGYKRGVFLRIYNLCILYIYIRRVKIIEEAYGYYQISVDKTLNGLNIPSRVGSACSEIYIGNSSINPDNGSQNNIFTSLPSLTIVPSSNTHNVNHLSLMSVDTDVKVQYVTSHNNIQYYPYYVDLCCTIPFINEN